MSCDHQHHSVNDEVGADEWLDSRQQPSLAENRVARGEKTLVSTREIIQTPEPIIPMFKKRKSERNWGQIQTEWSFYLCFLNRRLFFSKTGCKSQAIQNNTEAACLQVTRNCWLRAACSEEPTCWETLSKQRPECNFSRCGMALWQMKTLIRDGRVSILFFFNPYPQASA